MGTEMKKAMQNEDEEEEVPSTAAVTKGSTPIPLTEEQTAVKAAAKAAKELIEQKLDEEKAKIRSVRVDRLCERLRNKIALFTEQAAGEEDAVIASGVRTMWSIEAEELKQESYGAGNHAPLAYLNRSPDSPRFYTIDRATKHGRIRL